MRDSDSLIDSKSDSSDNDKHGISFCDRTIHALKTVKVFLSNSEGQKESL